jgi:CheY-like chemotaxis protein
VVVTDYDMPDMDGLTFADLFHARYPAVPILLVTALYRTLAARTARSGFVRVLNKPLNYGELRALLPPPG